jgi:hypothetical protein
MSVIVKAAAALPLIVNDATPEIFRATDNAGQPTIPCILSIPGSASHDHRPFNVVVSGTVRARTPGELTLWLLGLSHDTRNPEELTDESVWSKVIISMPEPIGGDDDLPETMWLIVGTRLMYSTISGKMQGTFLTNIADSPEPEEGISTNLYNIAPGDDPAIRFAVAASFVPTGEETGNIATLEIYQFNMED